MTRLPVLFVSHGSPMLAIDGSPANLFLKRLASDLPRPRAVVAVSAHWETAAPAVGGARKPETIHDFFGFPEALFQIVYPAPGEPAVADRARSLIEAAGLPVRPDPERGLDHGIWVPLSLIWPEADIPVVPVSVQPGHDPAHHLALGRALAPLAEEDVMIVATGATTHNLRAFRGQPLEAPVPNWVRSFSDWVGEAVEAGDGEALSRYRDRPDGPINHPSPEHFLPLLVAMGAAQGPAQRLHRSFAHAILSMDVWRWG